MITELVICSLECNILLAMAGDKHIIYWQTPPVRCLLQGQKWLDKSHHAVMDFDNAPAIILVFRPLTSSLLLTGIYAVFVYGHQTVNSRVPALTRVPLLCFM